MWSINCSRALGTPPWYGASPARPPSLPLPLPQPDLPLVAPSAAGKGPPVASRGVGSGRRAIARPAISSLAAVRIATWNVNSIRARTARVVDWLQRADVDVLALQEIKCRDDQFPH